MMFSLLWKFASLESCFIIQTSDRPHRLCSNTVNVMSTTPYFISDKVLTIKEYQTLEGPMSHTDLVYVMVIPFKATMCYIFLKQVRSFAFIHNEL